MRSRPVLHRRTKRRVYKLKKENSCSISTKLIKATSVDDGVVAKSLPSSRKDSPMVTRSRVIKWHTWQESGPNICQLPPEMLLKIFSMMRPEELGRSVAPVCRGWYNLAQDNSLWKRVTFQGMGVTTDQLTKLIQSKPQLATITLADRTDLNAILSKMVESNSNIKNLNIHRCRGSYNRRNIQSKNMVQVLRKCTELKSIIIEDTRFRSCPFYRVLLPKISREIKYLRMIVRPSLKEWKIISKGQHIFKLKIRPR